MGSLIGGVIVFALTAVVFWYLCVERPFNRIDGINCRPKLAEKLLNRGFHRSRRQISPPVKYMTHRFGEA